MSKLNSKTVCITMGDPAGVGPEVTAKALLSSRLPKGVEIMVVGNQDIWRKVWPQKRRAPCFIHVADQARVIHKPGIPGARSGKDSLWYLEKAVDLIKSGQAQALVTAPVSKELIAQYSPGFKGHTTFLANAFGCRDVEMVFVARDMKLVLVTRHIPVNAVSGAITRQRVVDVISSTHRFCVERFGIAKPKVAVLGLNPHAGEGGHIGNEEIKSIIPAIKKTRALGIDVYGPFPADTFFEPRNCRGFDLVVAMYHDQGLTALKALYFDQLVNLTTGLPFIRTSPVHGTAFGIAGKDIADAGSMRASLELACRL